MQTLRKTTVQTLVQAGLDIMPVPYRKDCKICKHRNHFRSTVNHLLAILLVGPLTLLPVKVTRLAERVVGPLALTASEGYNVGRKGGRSTGTTASESFVSTVICLRVLEHGKYRRPRSRRHLIDHIFGARITLILLFASLFY